MSREIDEINREIERISRTLSRTSDDHPNMAILLSCLADSHNKRFDLLQQQEDIDKVIEYLCITLTLTPDDGPGLSSLLATLGAAHCNRFQCLNEVDDIEKSIEYASLGLSLTPDSHPDLAHRLVSLGIYHTKLSGYLGEPDHLEIASEYIQKGLALIPDEDRELTIQVASSNLGCTHSDQPMLRDALRNIDKPIGRQSLALAKALNEHPKISEELINLGMSYNNRLDRLDDPDCNDFEDAIEYISRAISLIPKNHPDFPSQVASRRKSPEAQVLHRGEHNDLEDMIRSMMFRPTLTSYSFNDPPSLSDQLALLGIMYGHRFKCSHELGDLEKEIAYTSRGLALTSQDDSNLPIQFDQLGISHIYRFLILRKPEDIGKAVEYLSHSVALTPDSHPDLPNRYYPLARCHLLRYRYLGDHGSLQDLLSTFHKITHALNGTPRDKFNYAVEWAELALKHNLPYSLEAYQTAMNLLPRFIWVGDTPTLRHEHLLKAQTFAINAAFAAINSSAYGLALEWLEHARCVSWNQSLTLQKRIPKTERERVTRDRHLLATEYDALLSQTRELPGFEDFLRPTKTNQLIHAAQNGPVIIVNCHAVRCDALIILPDQDGVQHIPLPNFSADKAQNCRAQMERSLRRKGLRERGVKARQDPGYKDEMQSVLSGLWYNIVKPVLEFLGYLGNNALQTRPHITWCPTGALSFLPLHAAGDYDQPHARVFNYAITSYTPTLTALLSFAPSSLSSDAKILAIGLESTPGHSRLPGTARELTCVQNHSRKIACYTQISNHQATKSVVLDAMEQHDWVHLACHAHQNIEDATSSGFFLHDGTLDLASINKRWFKNKGLAFLSACQTATGDEKLPDEAIHLASGMLMAGYSSVIATMWSVVDEDAPFVADKVYGQLMKDGKVGNGEAGKALHYAVTELREKVGEKDFGRWVPYIHIGS